MNSIKILLTIVAATLLSCTQSFAAACGVYSNTVQTAINNGGCDSSVAMPLSRQIANEMICILGADKLTIVNSVPGKFNLGRAALGLLSPAAKNALVRATNNGSPRLGALQINSALRSVVQQHMLYQWWRSGTCRFLAVATPGTSNHESARAIDVNNNAAWKPYLEAQGFKRLAGDEVHFDYLSSPDLRGNDILAFQRLWNRNNPCDQIQEDSQWGSETARRVNKSPVGGFPIGSTCEAAAGSSSTTCNVPNVGSGRCYDVNKVTCRGTRGIGFFIDHCPGEDNIQCCVGAAERKEDSSDADDTTVLAIGLVVGGLGCIAIGGVVARRRKRATLNRGNLTSFSSNKNNRQSRYIGNVDIPKNAYK